MNINSRYTYILLVIIIAFLPDIAVASNPAGTTLCTVVGWFSGKVGAGLATLSILIIGIMALMGQISWTKCLLAEIDVVLIFGAGWFVEEFGGLQCPPA